MLGRYDPSIPTLAKHISNLREGLGALQRKGPVRERLQTPPAATEPRPMPRPGEQRALPEAPNIQAENVRYLNNALRKYGRVGSWVLRLVVGGAMGMLLRGGEAGSVAGEMLLGQAGVSLLMKALRSERVLNWMARPSAEDLRTINSLPPADAARLRQALGSLVNEERRQNPALARVPIDANMAAFLAGRGAQGATQSLQQLRQQAQQRAQANQGNAQTPTQAPPENAQPLTPAEIPPQLQNQPQSATPYDLPTDQSDETGVGNINDEP
jgi:hypothetical protein